MHHIDLCSGIGGFAYAFQTVGLSRPVMFCDTDAWCRKVLAKHWPDVPITDDVKVIANDPDRFIPRTDPRKTILTAGYPCQPFSVAGKQRGKEDPRHIYPHISEIIAHKRPAFVVLENVFGHLSLGLDEVLNDLANKDYAARAFIFPSGAIVGAPHHRNRIFIIARNVGNSEHDGQPTISELRSYDENGYNRTQKEQKKTEQFARTDRPIDGASLSRSERKGEQSTIYENDRAKYVVNAAHNRRDGRAAQVGRERAQDQPDESQSGVWCEPSRSGENVADTSGEQINQQRRVSEQQWGALGRSVEAPQQEKWQASANSTDRCGENVADTDNEGSQGRLSGRQDTQWNGEHGHARSSSTVHRQSGKDKSKPIASMGGMADGLPTRMDGFDGWEREPADIPRVATGIKQRAARLKGLGNAIVPQIAMNIGLTIKAMIDE